MTPGFAMLMVYAHLEQQAAEGRTLCAASSTEIGTIPKAGLLAEKVADQATQKVAESARGPVAEQATFQVADSATSEVADSATKNGPLPYDGGAAVARDTPTLSRTCPQDVPDLSHGTADGQPGDTAPPLWASTGFTYGWHGGHIVTPERFRALRQSYAESLLASLSESLPPTPNHESTTMNVNPSLRSQLLAALDEGAAAGPATLGPTAAQVLALSGALDAAGKIHAQAFGLSTIPGLIDALAKCQKALAEFLPKGDPADIAPGATPLEAHASPLEAPGEQGASEARNPPHAVNTLVATAYRATRENLGALQASRDELGLEMARQRERLLDLQEHFGSEEDAMRAMQTYLGPLP